MCMPTGVIALAGTAESLSLKPLEFYKSSLKTHWHPLVPLHWPNSTAEKQRRSLDKVFYEPRRENQRARQQRLSHLYHHHRDLALAVLRLRSQSLQQRSNPESHRNQICSHEYPPSKSAGQMQSKQHGMPVFLIWRNHGREQTLTRRRPTTSHQVEFLFSFPTIWKPIIQSGEAHLISFNSPRKTAITEQIRSSDDRSRNHDNPISSTTSLNLVTGINNTSFSWQQIQLSWQVSPRVPLQ